MEDIQVKQLYSGEQKTPFYPKVKLDAVIDKTNNQTLETILNNITNQIKAVWRTVYGVDYPNISNISPAIDSVSEVYDFLEGISEDKKLSNLLKDSGTGGGSNVSITNTKDTGETIATLKIDNASTDIKVPDSIISNFINDPNGFGLSYEPETLYLVLTYGGNELAIVNIGDGSSEPEAYYTRPLAPTNVNATYLEDADKILVEWNCVRENGVNILLNYITAYEIDRYVNGSFSNTVTHILSTPSSTGSYEDTDISEGNSYAYVIKARSSFYTSQAGVPSTKTNAVVIPSSSIEPEDTTPRGVIISFGNAEISNYEYSGTTYVNLIRDVDSNVETYSGFITVYGSREFLQTVNYVSVVGFNNESFNAQLGNIQPMGATYCKTVTVTFTPNWSDAVPVSSSVVNMYAKSASTDTNWLAQGTLNVNFVYPIYTGFVEKEVWDAGNHIGSYANETVIRRGTPLIQENGYSIIDTVFTCNLTLALLNDSSTNSYYALIAIPYNQKYMGYGVVTNDYNLTNNFVNYPNVNIPVAMDPVCTVDFKGIQYKIYTTDAALLKQYIQDGSNLKAVV